MLGGNYLGSATYLAGKDAVENYPSSASAGLHLYVMLKGSTTWTDIKADLRSDLLTFKRGMPDGKPATDIAAIGELKFNLDNSIHNSGGLAGYYSPSNANCRVGFVRNILVRLTYVLNGVEYPLFYGRLTTILPTPLFDSAQDVACIASDYMNDLSKANLTGLPSQANVTGDKLLIAMLASMTTQPNGIAFDTGVRTFPFGLVGGTNGAINPLQEGHRIACSERGFVYVKGGGQLRFENQAARVTPVPSYVLDNAMGPNTGGANPLIVVSDDADVINFADVTSHQRTVAGAVGSEVVLSSLTSSIQVLAGASITINVTYRDPNNLSTSGSGQIAGTNMLPPVATTDYTGNTASDGSGSDLTSQFTVVASLGATGGVLVVTNTSGTDGWLTKANVRGVGLYDYGPIDSIAIDATSQVQGQNAINIDLYYESDPNEGQVVAKAIIAVWSNPSGIAQQAAFQTADAARLLAAVSLDIGDCVTIKETLTGINAPFFINGVSLDVREGGNWIACTWILAPPGQDLITRTTTITIPTQARNIIIPNGARSMIVKAWGAGGGSDGAGTAGGGGGFAAGTVVVVPGETLLAYVGGHGINGATNEAGSGGGYTGIFRGSTPLIVAGGGGGAGISAAGGAGGGTTGGAGTTSGGAGGGGGGTPSAGGALGTGNAGNGSAGSSLTGGNGDWVHSDGSGQPGGSGGGGNAGALHIGPNINVSYVVTGGSGGAGGGDGAGTGSAGGVSSGTDSLASGSYPVTVGSAGSGGAPGSGGGAGGNSTFNSHTGTGGGGGTAGSASISITYELVAGGGSGGGLVGGGGGGGGVLQGTTTLAAGTYAVVVGAGGSGSNGGNSTWNGLTATGGGQGASATGSGSSGGCGGGGSGPNSGGAGSQGGNGGAGVNIAGGPPDGGGGGGGAGGNGGDAGANIGAGTTSGGAGGNGVTSTILGDTVGGGGGGNGTGSSAGGGTGGGGNGGAGGNPGSPGTNGLGGGGGGGGSYAGGSGRVVLRWLTASASATGGTQSTSGPYTIAKFTAGGNFVFTPLNGANGAAGSVVLTYKTAEATSTGGSSTTIGANTQVTFSSGGTFALTVNNSRPGGGGGAGYFGGGGGASTASNAGGGGGGSSFTSGSSTTNTQATGATPGGTGDANYAAPAGQGGGASAAGDGRLVLIIG